MLPLIGAIAAPMLEGLVGNIAKGALQAGASQAAGGAQQGGSLLAKPMELVQGLASAVLGKLGGKMGGLM